MADATINDLSAVSAILAAHVVEVDNASSADDSEKASVALLGALEIVNQATDANITGLAGTLHIVDMNDGSTPFTADRIYALPTTAQVGERAGVYCSNGDLTYAIEVRTTAASNDTIHGVDYDSADFRRVSKTGQLLVFRCIVADTDWVLEYDGVIGERLASGFIEIDERPLVWTSASAIKLVGPGKAMVDGALLTWVSDIASSYTPTTAGMKHVYLYDNSGTPALEINDTDVVAVWDADLNYWAKTADTSRRCVGAIWVLDDAATKEIVDFSSHWNGHHVDIHYNFDTMTDNIAGDIQAVANGTALTWTSVSLGSFGVPDIASHFWCAAKLIFDTANDDCVLGMSVKSVSQDAAKGDVTYRFEAPGATTLILGRFWMPMETAKTTFYRLQMPTEVGTNKATIEVWGFRARL